uniref:apoptosis regulatory protein Siva n=1 Tax=Myxine glutinosa TaxID=7769 RepID=UPI00358FC4F1
MPKRRNPFGDCSPLQRKTHVANRQVNEGVCCHTKMSAVYERTRNLLFAGAQAYMTSSTKQQALDHKLISEINGKAGEEVLQGLRAAGSGGRQRCLDGSGRLLSTSLPESPSRMSSSCETCVRPEPSQSHCSRCERRLCRECCRICGHCSSSVCSYCSMYKLNYEGRYEESFCHECFQD